jgi:hypothetical protein
MATQKKAQGFAVDQSIHPLVLGIRAVLNPFPSTDPSNNSEID